VADFAAAPQTVFEAWTNPKILRQWMLATPTNRVGVIGLDPTTGGRFAILTWEGEDQTYYVGEFLTVEPPRCLVFTIEPSERPSAQARATVFIEPRGKGSFMTFSHAGSRCAISDGQWRTMFRNLKKLLDAPKRRTAPARLFADTEFAKHDVEDFVHFNPPGESPKRPGRQA
jgi:uncharacterized protein YndB with AHSA1/START domain